MLRSYPWLEAMRRLEADAREFPRGLARVDRPPRTVWLAGALPEAQDAVAVVGTRFADHEALELASQLAGDLARAGYVVVSGGAHGIDAAAHRGALLAGGQTVAVLAGGLDQPYPRFHRELFGQIAAAGALVSERPPGTGPSRTAFVRRNRLIAGLASALVVVQAPLRSGALSTAAVARKIDIPVFSVPYAPWCERGRGTLELIRGGARICTCARDVLSVRPPGPAPLPCPASAAMGGKASETGLLVANLTHEGKKVYAQLGRRARHPDELAQRASLAIPAVQRALVELMLSGLATEFGNGTYVKS